MYPTTVSTGGSQHRKRLERLERPQQVRYLTFSCYGRLPLFANDRIKDRFSEHLAAARERFRFELLAWVVMPEHVHLLLLPDLPAHPVPVVLRGLKKGFAMEVIARWRELDARILKRITDRAGQSRFWLPGGGYDRNILAGHELPEKIRYIHLNPVRRGLVQQPTDWAWSSARALAGWEDVKAPVDLAGW